MQSSVAKLIKGLECLFSEEKLRICGLSVLEKRVLKRMTLLCKFMTKRNGVECTGLFSLDRICASVIKMHQRRFRPVIRKMFFTVRLAKHWSRLSREICPMPDSVQEALGQCLNNIL